MQNAYIVAPCVERIDAIVKRLARMGIGENRVRQITDSPRLARNVALPEATLEQRTDVRHSRYRATAWGLFTGVAVTWALGFFSRWALGPEMLFFGAAIGACLGLSIGTIVGVSAAHPSVERVEQRLQRGAVVLVVSAERDRLEAVENALHGVDPDIEWLGFEPVAGA